jgi:hypothetical protein
MSDSPPIASGLPHCRFARREHNSQWSAVYLHRGCMSTLNLLCGDPRLRRSFASWMHEHAQSVMRRSAVETFDPRRRGSEAIWARWKVG